MLRRNGWYGVATQHVVDEPSPKDFDDYRILAGTVRKFTPDARVAQMMDHFTQYVGSSPHGSPAVLCGIAHMQTDEGVWYPMGGMYAGIQALTKVAEKLGVKFIYD